MVKVFKGKRQDHYWEFLSAHGREIGHYDWSGWVLATLLPYLHENDIDLDQSELDDLSAFLCAVRENSVFILTARHREKYLEKLDPAHYSESELHDYYVEFNEVEFDEAGKAMLDGITLIRKSLEEVTPQTFVLLEIG